MLTSVKKWGNSASVRIPSLILETLNLAYDDTVDISIENGHIVIIPVKNDTDALGALLAGITPENLHQRLDFGSAQGRELI